MKAWYKEQRNYGFGKSALVQVPPGALVVWKAYSCFRLRPLPDEITVRRDGMPGKKRSPLCQL